MLQVALTLILILIGVAAYFYGAHKLAKFGFRLSTGIGLAVLLFPPYTFYFAFKKLEVAGKEFPAALCSFGLIVVITLGAVFHQEIGLAITGDFDEIKEMMTVDLDPGAMDRAAIAEAMAAGDEEVFADDEEAQQIAEEIQEQQEALEEAESEAEEDGDDADSDDDEDGEDQEEVDGEESD